MTKKFSDRKQAAGKKRRSIRLKKSTARNSRVAARHSVNADTVRNTSRRASSHSEGAAEVRTRALAALARMRREKVSRADACRLEHIKPATFMKEVGSAVRQEKPGGRFYASKGDTFRRDLNIPTAIGPAVVPVGGSKDAREISKYLNAIGTYLRTGDESKLRSFKRKTLKIRGQKIDLITDPATLTALAEADALHLDQLYASATGRA